MRPGIGVAALTLVALLAPSNVLAGDGSFPASRGFEIDGITDPQAVAVGDFNADGDQDLALAGGAAGLVTIRPGGPGATFPDDLAFAFAVGMAPRSIAVGDFNQDGDDDLVIANQSSNTVTIRPGGAGLSFPDAAAVSHGTGNLPVDVVVGNFGGDLEDDIATANNNNGNDDVTVRLGGAGATFPGNFNILAGFGPDALAIGDFDHDIAQDLAIANCCSNDVTIRPGDGAGGFPIGELSTLSGIEGPTSIVVGDFNRDGDEDLAIADDPDTNGFEGLTIRPGGAGTSFPAAAELQRATGSGPEAVAVGDFDSDGKQDLATANSSDSNVTIRRGGPRFPNSARTDVGVAFFPDDLAIGDFDGDGNQDLVTANFGDDSASIRLGGGPPALAGSLLVNGGFEGAGATREFDELSSSPIPGWQTTGTMTHAIYGMPLDGDFPNRLLAPRLGGGLSFLYNGGADGSTATQTVKLPRRARSAIKAGRASVRLSGQLGGRLGEPDGIEARATLLARDGSPLGSVRIGPVTGADRRTLTTLLRRQKTRRVSRRARRARVRLTATGGDDPGLEFDFAFADNVALRLDLGCAGKRSTKIGTHLGERLRGTRRADVIQGAGGKDKLLGRGNGDRLCGGAGRDKLKGGPGFDICEGGRGRDKASGCEVERSIP